MFGGRVFEHAVGIPMGTNCPLLADLFLYSYEVNFIQGLLKKNEKKLARSSNFTFRYIDDVLSLNNSRFGDFIDRIYPIELEIKDTTDTDRSASYLDLHFEIDSEGRLRTLNVNQSTISRLWNRFQQTSSSNDRPRSERPRIATHGQDRYIRVFHIRNQTVSASTTAVGIPGLRRISSQTVRNRLQQHGIRPRMPNFGAVLTPLHSVKESFGASD